MMDGAKHKILAVFTSRLQADLFVETFCRKFRQLLINYILNKENYFSVLCFAYFSKDQNICIAIRSPTLPFIKIDIVKIHSHNKSPVLSE